MDKEVEELKKAANPMTKLADISEKHSDKTDIVITLLCSLCDSVETNLAVNEDILKEKIKNHAVWLRATGKRFYVTFLGVMLTGAVLYLDVLELNKDSEIVKSVINLIAYWGGL